MKTTASLLLLASLVPFASPVLAADSPADTQYALAQRLMLNDRARLYAEAADEFEKFIRDFPQDPRVSLSTFWMAECRFLAQKPNAEEAAKTALPLYRKAADAADCERRAEARFRVAEIEETQGEFAAAADDCERFLKDFPDHELAGEVRDRDVRVRLARLKGMVTASSDADIALFREEAKRPGAVGRAALTRLASVLFLKEDFAGAAEACQKLLDVDPPPVNAEELHFNAAVALRKAGNRVQEALGHLEKVTTHRMGEASYLRGVLLRELKREDEALAAFRASVSAGESPNRLNSLSELAAAGDADARKEILDHPNRGPEFVHALRIRMAAEALHADDPDKALEHLAAVPKDASARDAAEKLMPAATYQSGVKHEKGDTAKATERFRTVVNSYPKDSTAPFARLHLAALEEAAGKRAEATDDLTRLLADYPDFPHRAQAESLFARVRYAEGLERFKANQFLEAAEFFEKAATDKELEASSTYSAALCYVRAEKPENAEPHLRSLLEKHSDYASAEDARIHLGNALVSLRKWQEAADFFLQRASNENDAVRRADFRLQAGLAFYQINQLPRARELLTQASEEGSPSVRARATFTLGEIALTQGDAATAKPLFLRVSVLYDSPELTPAALLEAAKCMSRLNENDKARQLLESIPRDYPNSPIAQEAKDLLKK